MGQKWFFIVYIYYTVNFRFKEVFGNSKKTSLNRKSSLIQAYKNNEIFKFLLGIRHQPKSLNYFLALLHFCYCLGY